MSKSRFVFKQIPVRRGSGNHSDLTRYVAKSKLDREREGQTTTTTARPLFTEHEDKLTSYQARKWLSITGGKLDKNDVLHYVLSFENAREYDLLGDDENERHIAVAGFLKSVLTDSISKIGIAEMRWVAGIHRNTGNPHLHLLLNKNVIEKKTGDLARIEKLPVPLIAHYEKNEDGTRSFNYGMIIGKFASQVDARHRERARFLQFENTAHNVHFTRGLLSPKILQTREPTAEEMLVGRWIVQEVAATTARLAQGSLIKLNIDDAKSNESKSNESKQDLNRLREEVGKLDRMALAHSHALTDAFIDTENLRSILINPPSNVNIFSDELEIQQTTSQVKERGLIHDNLFTHNMENNSHKTESKEKTFLITSPSFNR